MAPEILYNKHYDARSVDLFAATVVLFIMYSGTPPFTNALMGDEYYKEICSSKGKLFWAYHASRFKKKNYFSKEFIDLC